MSTVGTVLREEVPKMAPKPTVRKLMQDRRMTPTQLAEASGVARSTAFRVAGVHPSPINLSSGNKIAKALGVDVDEVNWPGGGLTNLGRNSTSGELPW